MLYESSSLVHLSLSRQLSKKGHQPYLVENSDRVHSSYCTRLCLGRDHLSHNFPDCRSIYQHQALVVVGYTALAIVGYAALTIVDYTALAILGKHWVLLVTRHYSLLVTRHQPLLIMRHQPLLVTQHQLFLVSIRYYWLRGISHSL